MLRIHFTREDLARTHVAEQPDPMWEIVLSLHMLQGSYARLPFAEWRHRVRGDLRRHGLTGEVRRTLAPLAPDASYFPDFLTPAEGLLGVEEGIEAVLATPRTRIRHELETLHQRHGAPDWAWRLAERPNQPRAELGDVLGAYHRHALAPYWQAISDGAAVDRARRTQALRSGGVTALLDSFRPAMRWRPPVLEVDKRHVDRDLYLRGRGLLLVPSHFCWHRPIALADTDLPPTLVYPTEVAPRWLDPETDDPADGDPHSALARLLGPTRAAILHASSTGPTTTEIARRLAISPASVSHHTSVLRDAHLITSHRHANNVFHRATSLGTALLGHQS